MLHAELGTFLMSRARKQTAEKHFVPETISLSLSLCCLNSEESSDSWMSPLLLSKLISLQFDKSSHLSVQKKFAEDS